MGCQTFCCRLLVRLKPEEMAKDKNGLPAKRFIDKGTQGLCIHMDQTTLRCVNWENRPITCREYNCNDDFMLQVVLREGFTNIADLARKTAIAYIPKETYVKVPVFPNPDGDS